MLAVRAPLGAIWGSCLRTLTAGNWDRTTDPLIKAQPSLPSEQHPHGFGEVSGGDSVATINCAVNTLSKMFIDKLYVSEFAHTHTFLKTKQKR